MDETVRLRMRRAHAKYEFYCSCGKVVHGNGGKSNHFYIGGQRWKGPRPGHRRLSRNQYDRLVLEQSGVKHRPND